MATASVRKKATDKDAPAESQKEPPAPTGPPPAPPSILDRLLEAVVSGNEETVTALLTRQNANYADPKRQLTLLMWAVEAGQLAIAETLLRHGARQHFADLGGFTALHRAAFRKNDAMVHLLLTFDASPQNVNVLSADSRRTPLILGAMQGALGVVQALLLSRGNAIVDLRDSAGMSAVDHAAFRGFESIVTTLAGRGAACNAALYYAGDGERHAMTSEKKVAYEGLMKYLYSPWSEQSVVTP